MTPEKPKYMRCPFCSSFNDRVLDTRPLDQSSVVRRRRACGDYKKRFTTYERLEEVSLMVIKSDQRREQFNRSKLREGVMRACEKRPISSDAIEKIVTEVENEAQDFVMEVPSRTLGEKVMQKLFSLDPVAYIRFASVYKNFGDIDTFMTELKKLRREFSKNKNKGKKIK